MRTAIRRSNDDKVLRRRMSIPRYRWAEHNTRWRGIYRNTGTTCSCWCCRIARRYYGPSMQERRQVAWIESVNA